MTTAYVILGAAIALGFSAYLWRIAFIAFRSGVARIAGGKEYKIGKNPLIYWFTVSIMACLGIIRLTKI